MSGSYRFSYEPLFLVLTVVAAALYLRAARRERPGTARGLTFTVGLLLLAVPVNSPLETLSAHSLLLLHLLQNALIADWAPPLLILGLTPAMRARLATAGGRVFREATAPRVALPVWVLSWYLIHVPAVYDATLRHPAWLNLEHAVLVTAGACFWWPVIADEPHRMEMPVRLAYLLAGSILIGPLGFVLLFMDRPLYGYYVHLPRIWGVSPLRDQQLGGIFMNAEQAVVFFIAVAWVFLRWVRQDTVADA
jgi:putative membrane protein